MKKIKHLLLNFPEVLIIVASIFYWISSGTLFNPIAIGLIVIMIVQLFVLNDFIGVTVPILLILASIFFSLALMSEYGEFVVKNAASTQLLLIGVAFIVTVVTASGLMIRKYTK